MRCRDYGHQHDYNNTKATTQSVPDCRQPVELGDEHEAFWHTSNNAERVSRVFESLMNLDTI